MSRVNGGSASSGPRARRRPGCPARPFADRPLVHPPVVGAGFGAGASSDAAPHEARGRFLPVQDGVDLVRVQELLGHESYATTRVYSHLDPRNHDAIIESWRRDSRVTHEPPGSSPGRCRTRAPAGPDLGLLGVGRVRLEPTTEGL
jgi:hypothetical protein